MSTAQALMAWSASIHNFGQVQAAHSLFGWHQDLVGIPCAWDGILCHADGTVDLNMRFMGLDGAPETLSPPRIRLPENPRTPAHPTRFLPASHKPPLTPSP